MIETVLVTGGTGFIASWVIVALLRQGYAARIQSPTLLVHSEHALAPPLARKFFDALGGPRKKIEWVESKGQIDFYDEPSLIAVAADLVAELFREAFASK